MNISTQFGDNLYFGMNLSSHIIDYNEGTFLRETNANQNSLVKRVDFENTLLYWVRFSAQFGAIAKIQNNPRLGLSYDTPTWYTISEETTQYLETDRVENGETILTIVDPRIINVCRLQTHHPGKVTASAAYIFNKQGLISLDYSYKDYGNIKLCQRAMLISLH